MMLEKNITVVQNFPAATECEWLETNGLGGWSSSTIIGCNTRRYHSLLMAATVPPAERMALVSKLDETIVCGDDKYELGTNNYGVCIHPTGYTFMTHFSKELFPKFTYEAGGVTLRKTIGMVHGENTVFILYDVVKAGSPFTLELQPLLSVRGYHNMMHANDAINRTASFEKNIFKTNAYEGTPDIFIKVPGGNFSAGPAWFYNFNYSVEQYRGLDFTEDLFTHGKFSIPMKQGDSIGIILSTDDPSEKDAHELLHREENRKKELLGGLVFNNSVEQILILAADQFIVTRGENLKTVIAGYHWFTDWSRDTMISLPGL
ncbi:MAG: glycogen debranching enzyme N-terminal domain-containing protein, partial [Bacteroidota bacterium]